MRAAVGKIVDASGRHPVAVLVAALAVLVVAWHFAWKVLAKPRTDLRELLPRDSAGLVAFERQSERVEGSATLVVVAESPVREHGEQFIAALATKLAEAKGKGADAGLVAYVESSTNEVHAFFEENKWLYGRIEDIARLDDAIDRFVAVRSGLVEDLDGAPIGVPASAERGAVGRSLDRWEAAVGKRDEYPRGYFETPDGTMCALRIVSRSTGMGDAEGESLLRFVQDSVREVDPRSFDPALRVGLAGDIANAVAEKDSVVGQAAWASAVALIVISTGVAWFFGSVASLLVIAFPAILGVGAAYAFAYFSFGYVNTTGMFLGAIILGNGVNYPIVLLARYREFRARGQAPADARRDATQNALRAELAGACVASIAYGSLTVTHFRGFSQFGWIGFVGMLLVWTSMIPCVPALLVLLEGDAHESRRLLRQPPGGSSPRGGGGAGLARRLARVTERTPGGIVALAVVAAGVALWKAPSFLRDPWEYDFDKLGSRGSKKGGAGEWSNKADAVFGGKMNAAGALMLADTPEQVSLVKARILANDAADPQGSLIAEVSTVDDLLPGTVREQEAKIEVLRRLRRRLTPDVVSALDLHENAKLAGWIPPEGLHVLRADDLPRLLRRRFEEKDGRVGAVFYVRYRNDVSLSDGHNLLRISRSTDNVRLPGGQAVQTASRATLFAEMIRSMARDGPTATAASLLGVTVVVLAATRSVRGAMAVLGSLALAVTCLVGGAAWFGEKLNYVNFIVLPITFGIGCEYPFNVYDRARLLGGDVTAAVERVGGAIALCSFTTVVGYASLILSDFQALQSFGRLAVGGELACVTGALLVLPALLHLQVQPRLRPCPRGLAFTLLGLARLTRGKTLAPRGSAAAPPVEPPSGDRADRRGDRN